MPSRFVSGNRITLLSDGDATFYALMDAIESARERVWLETYIFVPDVAGCEILVALTEAAQRGCDVLLMVDRFGAKALRDRHLAPLRAAGGKAVWFNPLVGIKPHGRKLTAFGVHRNHRKIFIVDGRFAFCGGRNVSMEYKGFGDDEFSDVMVRIEGPAVQDLGAVFLKTLRDASNLHRPLFPPPPPCGEAAVRTLILDPHEDIHDLDAALLALIRGAERELLFCTPYFIPPRQILAALGAAARRGVEVRVLTAGNSDVPPVTWAGRHLYPSLLGVGARIYEHTVQPLHAKFFVADRRRSIVGSYNADRWGQRYNQEVAVEVKDVELAAEMLAWFEKAARYGHRITADDVDRWSRLRQWGQAALYRASKLVAPSVPLGAQ